ncbi:hypothetical protein BDV28DRAFT_134649 [Aspergillus coremiiformis]|uniref:C2H2-type domain-containing protein n=1 Tax=Aspergillus coremiiformis TaxID=138285 RepID=A0A5N6Z4X6_9EURO|nr:hypothetical protein BDV28DRAFT_134649 [Aspergillus coremiiformis]
MAPRGFTNPAPKTESARSALSSFTCTLCNKSYSRHPEYEAHISSYDHQHRKRLQDLKQLSRDPNAAEKARRAERRTDAEAGLRVIDTKGSTAVGTGAGSGGGFKKGGFKSSFTTVKGPVASAAPTKKNVLGDEDDDEDEAPETTKSQRGLSKPSRGSSAQRDYVESETDEEDASDAVSGGYYDPFKPTGCFSGCAGTNHIPVGSIQG